MQQLIFRLLPVPLLFLLAFKGMAQGKDTVYLIGNAVNVMSKTDSLHSVNRPLHVSGGNVYVLKSDTVPYYKTHEAYAKADSFYRKKNTWSAAQYRHMDSLKRLNWKEDSLFRKTDSLFRKTQKFNAIQTKRMDSLKHLRFKSDSLFRKNDSLFRKTQRFNAIQSKRMDSLKLLRFKTDSLFRKNDSLFRKTKRLNAVQLKRMDSLKRLNWKFDSVRIKGNLQRLKSDFQRIKVDTVRVTKSQQKKTVSMEVSCNKSGTVSIVNLGRKLTIKTTSEEKVKLETTVYVQAGFDPKDVDWPKNMNILVEKSKNGIEIKRTNHNLKIVATGGEKTKNYSVNINGGFGIENNDAAPKTYRVDHKSPLVVYVPAGVKLNVESRYNELSIMDNMVNVTLDLLNTTLKMKDAEKAVIKSMYGSVNAGTINDADINLLNSKFTSGDLNKSAINSKYSTVVLKNSGTIDIQSVSDKYSIASADYVTANKSFGKMNIAQLGNSIRFTGSSADLEISAIDASAKLVQVENKYADVKLPVEKLLNYTVKFDGTSSNVFTPFEKIRPVASDSTNTRNASFTKTVGNVKNDFTAFVVNCISCSVDFR